MKHAGFLCSFGFVPVLLIATGTIFGMTCVLGAIDPWNEALPEVKLKNGTVLHNFQVVGVGSTTVVARWAGGQGAVVLTQLPQELQEALAPAAAPKPVATPASAPAVAAVPASAELPTEIKLTNGVVMHHSVVTHWEEDAVLVSYPGGIVPVRFKNIMPEQRVIFEARKSEALARQAKQAAAQIVAANEAAKLGEAQREREALQAAEAEQKVAAINRGVAERYLVVGMTKAQAKQTYGPPGRGDENSNSGVFIYYGRGTDRYGNNADRALFFDQNGILTGWTDERGNEQKGAVQRSQLDDGLHRSPSLPELPNAPASAVAAKPVTLPTPAPAVTAEAASAGLPTQIKLTNDFVMKQSTVMRWNKGSVLVRYQGGTVPVQFNNIVPEQRAIFVARESTALAEQAKRDVEQAAARSKAEPRERAERARAMWEAGQLEVHSGPPPDMSRAEWAKIQRGANPPQPWDDPDPEAIKQAISNHQLVKGMTKEQVRQSIGVPQTGYEKNSNTYIYLDRGRDKYGNHVNRILTFTNEDILMEWFDLRDGAAMSEAIHY